MTEISLSVRQKTDHVGIASPRYEVTLWNHDAGDDHASGALFSINFDKKEIYLYEYADALEELFCASNNVIVVYRQPKGEKAVRVQDDEF